jgi:hypothetical protein
MVYMHKEGMSETPSGPDGSAKSSRDGGLQLRPGAGGGAPAMPKINPLAGAKVQPPVVTSSMKNSASCGSLDSLDKINVCSARIAYALCCLSRGRPT